MNLSGNPLDFLWAFFGGVLISFTPCIYPLLPITITYIGASGTNSKIKGFTLSLVYVTGVSITYAVLGLIAVLTGSIFGQFSSLPLVRIVAGLIIILFGFTLWTGHGFRLPVLELPVFKRPVTYLSCFILGLASGLVVSPCTAPVLGSILIFVTTKRSLIYGALLLFSFAYGMGLLLILAGTFSSMLATLPKSGHWMEVIRKACAVVLIVAGIYFVISGTANLVYAQETKTVVTGFDFSLRDLDGNKVTLSEFENKKSVILLFWTTWCRFCREELSNLNMIYPLLQSEDIELLAIDVRESPGKVKSLARRLSLSFPILLDSNGSIANIVGAIGVPFFVLIDKTGKVVFMDYYFPQSTYKELLSN